MEKVWAGVDAGKEFHWAHVLDVSGGELLSRKVENDEADISALIDEALSFAEKVLWAVDQPSRVFYARLPRRHAAHLLAQAAKQLAE